ncbi:MAG: glycosyltransferase family 4 protein [Desulfoplanes sp.]
MHPQSFQHVRSVLYITDSTKHSSGGNQQLIINALAMAEAGLHVYVVVPPESGIAHALGKTPVHLVLCDSIGYVGKTALFLHRFTKKHAIDVVHTFHNKAIKSGILAKLLGGRFRLFLNRGVIYTPNALSCIFARISDGFVCNSYKAAEVLQKALVPASKTHVIFNAVTLDHAPSPKNLPTEHLRVTYVGNNNPVKGFDTFLQAVHILRTRHGRNDVIFQAFGTRADAATYPHVPQNVYANVLQHGTVPHDEVLDALSSSNIFVLSSRQESMPNVLLEAFIIGLPAVCTSVGGVPDLVRDGINGFICPPDAPECLASKIETLLNNAGLRRSMGNINRDLTHTFFTPASKGKHLLRLYNGEHYIQRRPSEYLGSVFKF